MTTEPAFVGEGRHAVVAGLVEAFDRVRAGGPAQWVALEAPSGWGKTRVLREFYRRLAEERQQDPAYWPPDILGTTVDIADDVGSRRKRLVPDVTHMPGSLPGYLWWGIACSLRGGVASAALRQDLAQVQAHADYLEDAWREVGSSRGRWASGLKDAGLAAADEAAMEVAGTAVESVLGAAIPGLGLVRWLGERGVAGLRAAADRRDRLASTERVEASDLVSDTAAMIGRLAVPGLPVIVAVEDLHDADAGLADLLATLVTGPASVLVITTSWPGRTTDNGHVHRAMSAADGERLVRLDHRTPTAPDPFGPGASLAELATDALAEIVRHYYPQVDETTLAGIVDRYPNPLALELFCQLPRVRRRGRSGSLRLDADVIANAPAEIRGLYTELWNELPETVREALSLAALGIPASVDPDSAAEWNTDLVLAALEALDWPSLDEIGDALRLGGDAYSWARSVSAMLRTFNEPDQRDIAATDDSFLFDDDRVEVRTAIGAALGRYVDAAPSDLGSAERNHLADLAAVLHAEGFLADPDTLADAVRLAAELTFDDQRDLPRIVRLLTRAIEAGPSDDRLARAHVLRGHAHLTAGRLQAALLDADRAAAVPDSPDLFELEVLNLRARVLTDLRQDTAAVDAYRSLVARMEQERGVDHPDSIAVRSGLVLALSRAGHDDEALRLRRQTIDQAERHLGRGDPITLELRKNQAIQLAERGQVDESRALFDEVEQDCVSQLGPEHPRTLTVRRNAAWIRHLQGDHHAAAGQLRALIVDHHRMMGADHPHTFHAQRLLGAVLAAGGDDQEAQEGVDMLIAMHAREVEVLGWDHPDVQETRRLVARLAIGTGEHDFAVRILERQFQDQERIHGPGALLSRETQVLLGGALVLADRGAEAIPLLESAVDGLVALTGPDSDPVFTARRTLGRALAEGQATEQALHEMRAAADVAARLWGPTDLRTVDVRDDIARLLLAARRHRDALVEWKTLTAVVANGLGADHEMTRYLRRAVLEVEREIGAEVEPSESDAQERRP